MNKVIHLKPQEDVEVDSAFIELLDQHCHQEGVIKPLSNTLFDRIEQLKLKAEAAKQKPHRYNRSAL
ncbi:MAG TPA: hypothetical protein DDZ41_07685 [Flavobacterium sp.]|nr:hypothetical protein [Flavobacterium sp.]